MDLNCPWDEILKRVQLFKFKLDYPFLNYAVSKTLNHLRAIRNIGYLFRQGGRANCYSGLWFISR